MEIECQNLHEGQINFDSFDSVLCFVTFLLICSVRRTLAVDYSIF